MPALAAGEAAHMEHSQRSAAPPQRCSPLSLPTSLKKTTSHSIPLILLQQLGRELQHELQGWQPLADNFTRVLTQAQPTSGHQCSLHNHKVRRAEGKQPGAEALLHFFPAKSFS